VGFEDQGSVQRAAALRNPGAEDTCIQHGASRKFLPASDEDSGVVLLALLEQFDVIRPFEFTAALGHDAIVAAEIAELNGNCDKDRPLVKPKPVGFDVVSLIQEKTVLGSTLRQNLRRQKSVADERFCGLPVDVPSVSHRGPPPSSWSLVWLGCFFSTSFTSFTVVVA